MMERNLEPGQKPKPDVRDEHACDGRHLSFRAKGMTHTNLMNSTSRSQNVIHAAAQAPTKPSLMEVRSPRYRTLNDKAPHKLQRMVESCQTKPCMF